MKAAFDKRKKGLGTRAESPSPSAAIRLAMARIEGRKPNASGQINTPGWEPVFGRMNAASQVPSGVLISTSVSTTSRPMAAADWTVATRPAPTKRAAKSRRVMSPGCASFVDKFLWSSVMDFPCSEFIAFGYPTASSDIWVVDLLDSRLLAYRDATPAPAGASSTN